MFGHVIAWYAKRIVNVNINIVLAGVLALGPVLICVKIAEGLLASGIMQNGVLQQHLETHHKAFISLMTFVFDIFFDVAIYFLLHWLANHAPRKPMLQAVEQRMERVADAAAEHVPFFKDAAKVQMQRAVLSPLLYFLWLGTQFALMTAFNFTTVWATLIGFCIAMGVVRSIHTFWMLKEERARAAVLEGLVCACGYNLRGLPPDVANCPECGSPRKCIPAPGAGMCALAPGGNGHAQSLSEKGEKSVSRS
jgi:hypothetical protein